MRPEFRLTFLLSFCCLSLTVAGADDASAGRDLFIKNCIACHAFSCNRDGQEAYSPKLAGLFGRKAGGVDDFDGYSQTLRSSEIVWTDETIDAYLRDPAGLSADSAMANERIEDAEQRRQMIAYLKTEDPTVNLFCSE